MKCPKLSITKEFRFEASHVLPWHQGKCGRQHGHSYVLFVTVEGELDSNGVIMDFADLKLTVNKLVVDELDHYHLNDLIENPTAERIAHWIWTRLVPHVVGLSEIKLYETATSYVTVQKENA